VLCRQGKKFRKDRRAHLEEVIETIAMTSGELCKKGKPKMDFRAAREGGTFVHRQKEGTDDNGYRFLVVGEGGGLERRFFRRCFLGGSNGRNSPSRLRQLINGQNCRTFGGNLQGEKGGSLFLCTPSAGLNICRRRLELAHRGWKDS